MRKTKTKTKKTNKTIRESIRDKKLEERKTNTTKIIITRRNNPLLLPMDQRHFDDNPSTQVMNKTTELVYILVLLLLYTTPQTFPILPLGGNKP